MSAQINVSANTNRDAWLAARRSGIGGTDIAAILGLSPYRTAVDVWLDKTGQAAQVAENEAMYWGNRLEDVVAQEFAARTGLRVQRVNSLLRHPSHQFALASIDRAIVEPGRAARAKDGVLVGASALLECKTASAYASQDWTGDDQMPIQYAAQCMWYLAVSGLQTCHVAALIGGNTFVTRKVERDEETIATMLEQARSWWQRHIIKGERPEPKTVTDVTLLFARDDGDVIDIDSDTDALVSVNELRMLREQRSDIDGKIEAVENAIKLRIGQASGLAIGGKPVVTWKAAKDSTKTDWRAVAADARATGEMIQAHTETVPGSRRFIIK